MMARAAHVSAWPLWARLALATVAGMGGALAHAPFGIAPAILIPAFAAFFLVHAATTTWRALLSGWALGLGYFALTLSWITEPFQVDAANTGWMAPFALVLLALLLGAFWAVAVAFASWAGGRAWVLIFAWTGAEILRAYVFTGFPWAMLPQALVDANAGQALAWLGPHGLMLLMIAAVATAASVRTVWTAAALASALVAATLIPVQFAPARLTDYTIRLVQPNVPQNEKWEAAKVPVYVSRLIDYTAADDAPDLVIWPETALPYLLENAQPVLDEAASAARGGQVVLGIQRRDDESYFNSLAVLDETGQVSQTYDKHHLVPFGEYMPLPGLFRNLGVRALAERADSGYGRGPGPRLLEFGAAGRALPLICYEAVFAHDVGGAPDRPDFLMQLTNDAWFGTRSGPQQHLAQARMRAIEQGLPMARAANTGISAMIDSKGRITASLALNTAGFVDAALPAPGAPTIYSRTGDVPWILLVLGGLLVAILRRARMRRKDVIDVTPPEA
jgi:apolipoprotein N-acyltransferase